ASLMKHRAYWQAVLLDLPGEANYQRPGHLLMSGLIKLRDVDDNIWNADQLFILTAKREQAVQLARIIEEEDWGGAQPVVYSNHEEMDSALGTGRQEHGLLSIWWDRAENHFTAVVQRPVKASSATHIKQCRCAS